MKATGWIITIAISILTCAVLELNKNTLPGWLLLVLALIGMAVISRKYMGAWNRWKKALGITAYFVVCACIVFVTWPPIKRVPAADKADPPKTEVYSTAYGDVRGVVLDSGVEPYVWMPCVSRRWLPDYSGGQSWRVLRSLPSNLRILTGFLTKPYPQVKT